MRKLLIVLLVSGFPMAISTNAALAGGSSDTSGDGLHCYMFFDNVATGSFAQVMINQEDSDDGRAEMRKKILEFLEKYIDDEGGMLVKVAGNFSVADCQCTGSDNTTSQCGMS